MRRLGAMWKAGGRAVVKRPGLVGGLYAVQLAFALVATIGLARALTAIYGGHALFDRAVKGDLAALVLALVPHAGALQGLVWIGLALAIVYALLSWYLTAGLLGSLRSGPAPTRREGAARFGAAAATHGLTFARLWLWSLIPSLAALVVIVLGMGAATGPVLHALTMAQLLGPPLYGAAPGLLLLAIVFCAVDYARVILVRDDSRASGKALLAGLKLVFTRPLTLLHYLAYLTAWGGVTALYVFATVGRPFAGAGGAFGLFLLRQLVSGTRFAARVGTFAGQQQYLDSSGR